jgi:Zn-dependent peptidase ImmA (M78 family)/transcriptional regulator with XRE-family HTH domain
VPCRAIRPSQARHEKHRPSEIAIFAIVLYGAYMGSNGVSGEAASLSERIRDVIVRSGLTNAEFAETIGIDPPKLSKSLSGSRRFTTFELAAIANRAQTTVDWLLTGIAPDRALVATRMAPEAPEDVLALAERRVRALAEVEAALCKLSDWPLSLPLPTASLTGRFADDAESMADSVLDVVRDAGLGESLRSDPASVFETLFGINIAFETCGSGFDGIALNCAASRVILVNTSIPWSRQRFTLAHEIGHIVAEDGRESGVCIDEDVMASQRVEEIRANAFAACLLMPRSDLQADLQSTDGVDDTTFGRLLGKYRVSASAMAWRLKDLGFVDAAHRGRLGSMRANEAAWLGDWQAELAKLAVDQRKSRAPRALLERTILAFANGTVSARLVATVLDADPDEVLAAWQELTQAAPAVDDAREAVFVP